jgi:hypothetical protein
MQYYEKAATVSTPWVRLDPASGRIELVGESYPANSFEFYQPIVEWLGAYLEHDRAAPVHLELELSYVNTGSIKSMLDIFDMLEHAHQEGRPVKVVWKYDSRNQRALETADEFSEDVSFAFVTMDTFVP